MPNIPKPELERGNYITYADEPGTIYEPDSGGGGGGGDEGYNMNFIVTLINGYLSDYATIPFIKIDGEEITGFEDVTEPDNQSTYKKTITVKPGSIVEPNREVTGYLLDDFFGCYEVRIMGNAVLDDAASFAAITDKKTADWYAAYEDMGAPIITASYNQEI